MAGRCERRIGQRVRLDPTRLVEVRGQQWRRVGLEPEVEQRGAGPGRWQARVIEELSGALDRHRKDRWSVGDRVNRGTQLDANAEQASVRINPFLRWVRWLCAGAVREPRPRCSEEVLPCLTTCRRSTSASAVGRLVRLRRRRQRSAPSAVGQGSEDVVSDPWIGASPKGVVRDVAAVVEVSSRRLAIHLTSSCGEVAPRPERSGVESLVITSFIGGSDSAATASPHSATALVTGQGSKPSVMRARTSSIAGRAWARPM